MPNRKASTWNCKYKITTSRSLVDYPDSEAHLRGYHIVEVEMYGFDEEVYVISMPYKQFYDFDPAEPNKTEGRVLKAEFGSKFIVPAEDDVMISFAPVGNKEGSDAGTSPSGKFRVRTKIIPSVSDELLSNQNV